jgi:hypothetical protein
MGNKWQAFPDFIATGGTRPKTGQLTSRQLQTPLAGIGRESHDQPEADPEIGEDSVTESNGEIAMNNPFWGLGETFVCEKSADSRTNKVTPRILSETFITPPPVSCFKIFDQSGHSPDTF